MLTSATFTYCNKMMAADVSFISILVNKIIKTAENAVNAFETKATKQLRREMEEIET